jgi:GTP-binding protein
MTNNPDKTNFAYERYISNQFRYHFGFEGTPLNFIWRKKNQLIERKQENGPDRKCTIY